MTTGPHSVYENTHFQRKGKEWYRQAPPFSKPLYYHTWFYTGTHTDTAGATYGSVRDGSLCLIHATQITDDLIRNYGSMSYRRAHGSFSNKLDDELTASAGITIAETSASVSMIASRTEQLIEAGIALKRRDFGRIVEAFGLAKTDSRAKRVFTKQAATPANVSSNYLEWIFGWQPMISDIYSAAKVLSSTPRSRLVRSGGGESFDHTARILHPWGTYVEQTGKTVVRRFISGRVDVVNPNVDLLNRLGLINPVQIVYNVIPGSFLLDWFLPVNRYLGAYSTMWGRSLNDGQLAVKITCNTTYRNTDTIWGDKWSWVERGEQFERLPIATLPRPTRLPDLRLPIDGLLGRAVSLTALFAQQFTQNFSLKKR